MPLPARVCVGEITTAHGVRGLVKVRCYCEDPDLLDQMGPLFTSESGDKTLELTLEREANGIFLASVDGIPDRTAAEKLRGTKLYLPRDMLPDIDDDGTFYYIDLIGLKAIDATGAHRGQVVAVQNFGAGDLIEIRPVTGGETYYLPFDNEFVPHVDIAGGCVTINPSDELLNPAKSE